MEREVYIGTSNLNMVNTDSVWKIGPVGFRATLRKIYSKYRLPMIVTENGLGSYDILEDVHDYRIECLRQHIEQIKEAITDRKMRLITLGNDFKIDKALYLKK